MMTVCLLIREPSVANCSIRTFFRLISFPSIEIQILFPSRFLTISYTSTKINKRLNINNKYKLSLYSKYIFHNYLSVMQDNNRKLDFQRVSEVLKSRLVINNDMDIINQEVSQHADEGQHENDALFYDDNSNDDYLFGDRPVNTSSNKYQKPKQPSEISKQLSQEVQARPNEEERPVIKRKVSRAASQPNQIKKAPKPKYKKKDNAGNQIVRNQKIQAIFRKICEPNRTITVNSLGHALQRFKIKFQLKDIVEMLSLYHDMMNPQKEASDQEDKQQQLDLNAKMTENQFKEFFQMIRKRPKE